MISKRILITIVIGGAIFTSSIFAYAVYFSKSDTSSAVLQAGNKTSGREVTILSTEPSIQTAYLDLTDLSLKGYLKTPENVSISGKIVQISLKGIQNGYNQTKEENMVVGNSTTDREGCFYFNNWNDEMLNNALREIPKSYNTDNGLFNKTSKQTLMLGNSYNMLWFATNFTGDGEFLPSSNTTEIRFSPVLPPMERLFLGIYLVNDTTFVNNMYLKRGQSYEFKTIVYRGDALVGSQYDLLKLDVKGLPCGITSTFENNVANLTEQYNVTTHLKISVNENARSGEYYYFIMGNNWILNEGKLIIE